MERLVLLFWLLMVLGVVLMQCQPNEDAHSLNDDSLSRVVRQSEVRVAVLELPPYVKIDKSREKSDQGRYSGIFIDVLKKVAEDVGFRYKIELQTDELPGQRFSNGSWDGLVERLFKKEVDLGGPLHITKDRLKVLDFTKPIVNTGISFLIQTPKSHEINLNLIFQPFSTEVWLVFLIAFIIFSILFYTISRVSPYSNAPRRSVTKTNGILSKIADPSAPFSIKNSFLYMLHTLTFQGHRDIPKSWSARILNVIWSVFCLLIIIIYAANLSSFLLAGRNTRSVMKYYNIDQLMRGSFSRIGIVRNRYEDVALKDMDNGVRAFTERRGTFLPSYSEGIRWLEKSYGHKALAMDTQAAKYVALRHCYFKKFPKPLNFVGMGFATALGNRVISSSQLNQAILRLHEDGTLTTLLKKWLYEGSMCGGEVIDVPPPDAGTKSPIYAYSMTLKDLSSPLIFVFVGALVSVLLLIAEVIYYRCIAKKTEKVDENKLEEGDGDITKDEVVVASP